MALINSDVVPFTGGAYEIEQSLRFNDDDSAYLSWTPSSAGNRKTWTWSGWVKLGNLSPWATLFGSGTASTDDSTLAHSSNSEFYFYDRTTGKSFISDAIYRDPSAWYHVVFLADTTNATTADRLRLYVNGERVNGSTSSFPVQNTDLGVNNSVAHYLGARKRTAIESFCDGYMAEVNFIDGQALDPTYFGETADYGEWKPIEYTGTYGTNGFYLPFKNDYAVEGFSTTLYTGDGSSLRYIGGTGFQSDLLWLKQRNGTGTHEVFDSVRGSDGVYRRLLTQDTGAEDTAANTVFSLNSDGFTVGSDGNTNGSADTMVAWAWDMGANSPTGFMTVTYTGDGSSSKYIGDVGFQPDLVWIKRRDAAASHAFYDSIRGPINRLITDSTSAEDSADTGSLLKFEKDGFTIGNQSHVNLLNGTYTAWCWDMGGETVSNTDGSITSSVRANPTYGQSMVTWTAVSGGVDNNVGVGIDITDGSDWLAIIKNRDSITNWYVSSSSVAGIGTAGYLTLNNTNALNTGNTLIKSATSTTVTIGNGFTDNSTDEQILYLFKSVTGYSKIGSYTGNGSTTGPTVTTGFRPAFLMVKETVSGGGWLIVDNVRDDYNPTTQRLNADTTSAEDTSADNNVEFTDTGFQIKTSSGSWNQSGVEIIYMAFAGGADSISDYNTDGSIDSRVKANTTYGQSIVSYVGNQTQGATVGHGLSSAPEMIIIKNRDSISPWAIYHTSLGANYYLRFTNQAVFNSSTRYPSVPSSTVFTIGNDSSINGDVPNQNLIAYCFHSVSGYSKFGSYTGTSSAGNTITTGFKPAFVMVKRTDTDGYDWRIHDSTRLNDGADKFLRANTNATEGSNPTLMSFSSTGFSLDDTNANYNVSGGTYIYMAFADKREFAYWLDQSGNNNDWTSNNLTESDISVDSPTNNFATLNPLSKTGQTLSEGNAKYYSSTGTSGQCVAPTFAVGNTGKWYWEVTITSTPQNQTEECIGLTDNIGSPASLVRAYNSAGNYYNGVSWVSYGDAWSINDVFGLALNIDDSEITFYRNGVSQGTQSYAWNENGNCSLRLGSSSATTYIANFGQDSSFAGTKTAQGNTDDNGIGDFYYTPPSGYLALCTANLPDPAVIPSEHFNTVLYTGDGSYPRSVTGVGFQPDFVWAKSRNAAHWHVLYDAVRGAGTDALYSNSNEAEGGAGDYTNLTSFDSDGYSIGSTTNTNILNNSGDTFVAWNWKANGSGSSNTNGSITSTVSANQDAGFSIVSYGGNSTANATVGHGLSSSPELVIIKPRSGDNWVVWYKDSVRMLLNGTNADIANHPISTSATTITLPTSTDANWNGTGTNYISYVFHSVDGFSKVGSYTGNGSTDGTFVYTGFRPAWIMIKRTDAVNQWIINDNKRDEDNPTYARLWANLSNAEDTSDYRVDLLSNGFKCRQTSGDLNVSGGTYIYIAFAENPFKYTNAR